MSVLDLSELLGGKNLLWLWILPARQLKPTHGPPGDLRTAVRPAGPHPSRSARPLEAGRGRGPCFRKPARRPRERGGSGRGPWEGDGPDAPDAMSSNARLARPRFCECAHTLLRARKAFGAINRAAATSRKASARQPGACRADSDGCLGWLTRTSDSGVWLGCKRGPSQAGRHPAPA